MRTSEFILKIPSALKRRFYRILIQKRYKSSLFIQKGVRIASPEKIQIHGTGSLLIGINSIIEEDSLLNVSGDCLIGQNCYLSTRVLIGCADSIKIGDQVAIGPNVVFLDSNHNFGDINLPIVKQGATTKPIVIHSNCWIGANVTILPGVTLNSGVVVAAGAVVTKNFGPNLLIGGVPAVVIRNLDK